jgi:hypothetical protein
MPLMGVRGGGSIKGYGFSSVSLGVGGWIGYSATNDYSDGGKVCFDSTNVMAARTGGTPWASYHKINMLTGNLTKQVDISSPFYGPNMAVDSSNNIYLGGFNFTASFYGAFVKLNSSDVVQLQKQLNITDKASQIRDVEVDSSGNIYLGGGGNLGFGDSQDGLIWKYNSSGALQWQNRYYQNISAWDDLYKIRLDSTGANIFASGVQYSSGNAQASALIAKVTSSGSVSTAKKYTPSSGNSEFFNLTTDSSNNVYGVGFYNDSTRKGFIAKLDSSLNNSFQFTIAAASTTNLRSIAVDSVDGSIYACGEYYNGSKYVMLVIKLNSSGVIQWQRSIENTASGQYGYGGISVNGDHLYIAASKFMFKLPKNGTGTGTYVVGDQTIVYAASSLTTATPSYTLSSATLNVANPSMSESTPTNSASTGTQTYSVVTL